MKINKNNSIICYSDNPIFNKFYNDYSMGLHLLLDFYIDDRRFVMNFNENGMEKNKFICDLAYEQIENKMFYVQSPKKLESFDKVLNILNESRKQMIKNFEDSGVLEFNLISQ